MNWLLIIILILLVSRMVEGYKRGMVKEIISLVSLIVLCLAFAFIGGALLSYLEKDIVSVVVAIILLLILAIGHWLLNVFFCPAKLLVKLPIVKSVDKLLGVVMGIIETVLLVWTLYTLLLTVEMGTIGQQIMAYVQDSTVLTFLYKYNYLAYWVSNVIDKLTMLPI